MKKTLVLFLCLGGVLAFNVALAQLLTIHERNVIEEVDYLYRTNNKYPHIPLTNFGDFSYEVHEYLTPDNNVGYQVFYFYPDRVLSIGSGVEFENRTYEYIYTTDNFISSSTVSDL